MASKRTGVGLTKRGNPRLQRPASRPGRKTLPRQSAADVRGRLKHFIRVVFKTVYEFEHAYGVPHSTTTAWFRPTASVPDVGTIWPLVERGLSLDWLYTGRGQPFYIDNIQPEEGFKAKVLGRLRHSLHAGRASFDECWARLELTAFEKAEYDFSDLVADMLSQEMERLLLFHRQARSIERVSQKVARVGKAHGEKGPNAKTRTATYAQLAAEASMMRVEQLLLGVALDSRLSTLTMRTWIRGRRLSGALRRVDSFLKRMTIDA